MSRACQTGRRAGNRQVQGPEPACRQHAENDLNVPFVSGSARFDAMVIVPCSMATLGRIASGSSDSALLRAADVFLKERRKLIVVPRETPWSLIHARNVVTLLEAGAIVLPAIPSFYSRPQIDRATSSTPSSGAFSIRSACRIRAPIAGRDENESAVKIENRQAGARDGWSRSRIGCCKSGRARFASRSKIAAVWCESGHTRALHRRALAQPAPALCLSCSNAFAPQRRGAALISASRDGDVARGFGRAIRISKSCADRVPARAQAPSRQLAEVVRERQDVVITPDGPRGPAYRTRSRASFSSRRKSGAAVVPMNMEYSSCWRLKSWDRFILPRPFLNSARHLRAAASSSRPRRRPRKNSSANDLRLQERDDAASGTRTMNLIDGRAVAEKVYAELRGEIARLKAARTHAGTRGCSGR